MPPRCKSALLSSWQLKIAQNHKVLRLICSALTIWASYLGLNITVLRTKGSRYCRTIYVYKKSITPQVFKEMLIRKRGKRASLGQSKNVTRPTHYFVRKLQYAKASMNSIWKEILTLSNGHKRKNRARVCWTLTGGCILFLNAFLIPLMSQGISRKVGPHKDSS